MYFDAVIDNVSGEVLFNGTPEETKQYCLNLHETNGIHVSRGWNLRTFTVQSYIERQTMNLYVQTVFWHEMMKQGVPGAHLAHAKAVAALWDLPLDERQAVIASAEDALAALILAALMSFSG